MSQRNEPTIETYEFAKQSEDKTFLRFIYDRMLNIHGEDANIDYMQTLASLINFMEEPAYYKGRIYDGQISMRAWSIATRLEPIRLTLAEETTTISTKEQRQILAVVAQIGLDWGKTLPSGASTEAAFRKKLTKIQQVLDGDL